MRERVFDYIQANRLISPGDRVLVGLSGGGDSVVLLHMLYSLKSRLDISLCAAHLNHGIRGKAADEDAEFVRDICDFYGISVYGGYIDVPTLAKRQDETLEQAARGARYDFLEQAREFFGADKLAVAHHMDDQAESIMLHLLRGSGLRGLCGMAPARGNIIRPLLCLNRAEIEQYLEKEGLDFCTDATNFIADGTRNKLRLEALPYLKGAFNPRLTQSLCSMGEMLREDEDYLCAIAKKELDSARRDGGFDRTLLIKLPTPILSRCIRLALEEINALTDAKRAHINDVVALMQGRTGTVLHLPGADAWIDYDLIRFGKFELPDDDWQIPLSGVGEIRTPDGVYTIEACDVLERPENKLYACIDLDKLPKDAVIRRRRAGDRFFGISAPGTKKVKEAYINAKVSRDKRELPLIASGSRVMFAPFLGAAEEVKIDGNTMRAVRIKYTRATPLPKIKTERE